MWEGAYLEGSPPECWVRASSEVGRQGLLRQCGVCLGEEEGGDPAVQGEEGEVCLCGEREPGGMKQTDAFFNFLIKQKARKIIIFLYANKVTE